MVRGRGNNVDNAILDHLRQIVARLDAVETTQRRGAHLEDVSDDEVATQNHNPEPEEDQDEERLLRVFSRENSKRPIEVVPYDRKLDTNVVLDWISNMEKFFEYENTPDNRKINIVVTRLKGHASLWWEHLQTDRQRRGKEKIKTWPKMVNKEKKKFLPTDYQVSLLRKMQNLKQRDMTMKEYTEEFYRLDIRFGHVDDDVEKITRYLNGMRSGIQDKISFVKLESVEEAYQYALKSKEILIKKHEQRKRGRGSRF